MFMCIGNSILSEEWTSSIITSGTKVISLLCSEFKSIAYSTVSLNVCFIKIGVSVLLVCMILCRRCEPVGVPENAIFSVLVTYTSLMPYLPKYFLQKWNCAFPNASTNILSIHAHMTLFLQGIKANIVLGQAKLKHLLSVQ